MTKKPDEKVVRAKLGQNDGQVMLFEVLGIGDYYVPCHVCKHDKVLLRLDYSTMFCSKCDTDIAFPLKGKQMNKDITIGDATWKM